MSLTGKALPFMFTMFIGELNHCPYDAIISRKGRGQEFVFMGNLSHRKRFFCITAPLEYLIKKLPIPTKRATVILIKVKSRNALVHMLLVCIGINKKSVLRYKFVIFDTYLPDVSRVWGIHGYFWKPKGVCEQKNWGTLA
jgi:hypothetical protein